MITAEENIFPLKNDIPDRITLLKQKIDDNDYLFEAIQRIAQVLSNEISGIPGMRRRK
ncbi:hypothetical protein AGMMS50230_10710 [Spirochaetia bacterium]|nr:hypothetical protein AGMMS50230_10710 [Spirochaetia bacterium]